MTQLHIAVVGCGSAGPAAALLLHRAGHRVEIFERVPELLPVGAGFLLQPSGLGVLQTLGLLETIVEHGAPVSRLHCTTRGGARLLDLQYGELAPGLHGIGLHRATLLHALVTALERDGIPMHLGADVTHIELDRSPAPGTHHDAPGAHNDDPTQPAERANLLVNGERRGPYDLVIVADGARSALRSQFAPPHSARRYPWGALWFIGTDADGAFDGQLSQVVHGTRAMVGFLPTGRRPDQPHPLVSLFWSLPIKAYPALRAAGLDAWKRRVLRLAPRAGPLLEQIQHIDQLTLASYMDVRMSPWNRGPVLFIGDAAHATSPQLGQGVNLALLDAEAIAKAVQEALFISGSVDEDDHHHDLVQDALANYCVERRSQLGYYQFATRWLTPFFQSHHLPLGWLRDLGFRLAHHISPLRRQMIATMCGTKQRLLGRALAPAAAQLPAVAPSAEPADDH